MFQATHSEKLFIKEEPQFEQHSDGENSERSSDSLSDDQNDDHEWGPKSKKRKLTNSHHGETSKGCLDTVNSQQLSGYQRLRNSFSCGECDVKINSYKQFVQHKNSHKTIDKSLFCEECSKQLKTPADMQFHLATDHGRNKGPVDCPICFKKYQDNTALRSHYYIHTLERKFLCGT